MKNDKIISFRVNDLLYGKILYLLDDSKFNGNETTISKLIQYLIIKEFKYITELNNSKRRQRLPTWDDVIEEYYHNKIKGNKAVYVDSLIFNYLDIIKRYYKNKGENKNIEDIIKNSVLQYLKNTEEDLFNFVEKEIEDK